MGLYDKNSKAVPLRHIDFRIKVVNSVASFEVTQVYENLGQNPIETEFFFPADPFMSVTGLVITIGEKTIEGKIMGKEKAEEKYDDAIASGNTAAKLNYSEDTPDLLRMMVGNLGPKQEAHVTVRYVKALECEYVGCYSVRVPLTYIPPFIPKDSPPPQNLPPAVHAHESLYKVSFDISIYSTGVIKHITAGGFKLDRKFSENKRFCQLSTAEDRDKLPNRDFMLSFSTGDIREPQLYLQESENHPEELAALISFIPNFSEARLLEEAQDMEDEEEEKFGGKEPQEMIENSDDEDAEFGAGEFIFVLDRSGSMGGSPINIALSALRLFL